MKPERLGQRPVRGGDNHPVSRVLAPAETGRTGALGAATYHLGGLRNLLLSSGRRDSSQYDWLISSISYYHK